MATSHPLPPAYLSHMKDVFYVLVALSEKNGSYFNVNGPIRQVDHWSRQTFDVSAAPYNVNDGLVRFFTKTDAGSATPTVENQFILAPEPALVFGEPTNGSTFLGMMAQNFIVATERIAQSGAAGVLEVNPAMEVFESAVASMDTGNTKVVGPTRVGEALRGSRSARASVDAAGTGDLVGTPFADSTYALEPSPLIIEPLTTLNPRVNIEGDLFATLGVTEDPLLTWNLKMLAADGAYNLDEPRIPNRLMPLAEQYL